MPRPIPSPGDPNPGVHTDGKETTIKVIDLFAGAGGLTAGFKKASNRFDTIRAVEMDLAAAASYEATFGPDIVYAGTIQSWLDEESVPLADLVVGGPPCQGFSTLGKQDAEDERNSLWEHYVDTIVRARPKYFVVENVAAFSKSAQYLAFQEETSETGRLRDYSFQHRVLNAADYGAPQARKRTVIIGHLKTLPFPGFPEPTHVGAHVSVRSAFASIPPRVVGIEYASSATTSFRGKDFAGPFFPHELHLGRSYTPKSLERFSVIPEGGNRFDLAASRPDLLPACWVKHTTGSADVMGRLNWDKPSVTIRTEFFKPEKGRYLHPTEHRAITHYEAAVLQGFPDDHRFVGSKTAIAKQIGNAVPIPLGEAIGRLLAPLF